MKKIILLLFFPVLVSVFSGCQQNITLDLPVYNGKVAVYCVLSPGAVPKMYLNLSKSFYNYTNNTDLYRFIKNAEVYITNQTANIKDTLHLDSAIETGFQGPEMTWFYTGKRKAIQGNHYIAEIKYNGATINSETTVPIPISVDHFNYKKGLDSISGPFSFPFTKFSIFFRDREGEDNSYKLTIYPPNQGGAGFSNQYISDLGLDGTMMEEDYTYTSGFQNDSFTIAFTVDNTTRATAAYLNDVQTQAGSAQDPFSEPVAIQSNINGGLGIFGATAPSEKFYIKVK